MIQAAILAVLRASVGNPEAIELLAHIELRLSQNTNFTSGDELGELLDKWGNALANVDAEEVLSLKRQLRRIREQSAQELANEDHDGAWTPGVEA